MFDFSGFTQYFIFTGTLERLVLLSLLSMSIASWYVIAIRVWRSCAESRRAKAFHRIVNGAATPGHLEKLLDEFHPREPLGRLSGSVLGAIRRQKQRTDAALFAANSPEDFVNAALRCALIEETTRAERGLTLLASVGSTAPFVGLLGTVWGIYHALQAIGLASQASLDKVAGPIGQALIMTACGLAVAIPSVLAHNAFVRELRSRQSAWECFAGDLLAFLATGVCVWQREPAPLAVSVAEIELMERV